MKKFEKQYDNNIDISDHSSIDYSGQHSSYLTEESEDSLSDLESDIKNIIDENKIDLEDRDKNYRFVKTFCNYPEKFKGKSEIKLPQEISTNYDLFRYFFDNQMINDIIEQTNLYVNQKKQLTKNKEIMQSHPYCMLNKWKDMDKKDLFNYLAITMLFGIHDNKHIKGKNFK